MLKLEGVDIRQGSFALAADFTVEIPFIASFIIQNWISKLNRGHN